jgi:hypothetical protein
MRLYSSSPLAEGATLRVVRLRRRAPIRLSSSRMVWLSAEGRESFQLREFGSAHYVSLST